MPPQQPHGWSDVISASRTIDNGVARECKHWLNDTLVLQIAHFVLNGKQVASDYPMYSSDREV